MGTHPVTAAASITSIICLGSDTAASQYPAGRYQCDCAAEFECKTIMERFSFRTVTRKHAASCLNGLFIEEIHKLVDHPSQREGQGEPLMSYSGKFFSTAGKFIDFFYSFFWWVMAILTLTQTRLLLLFLYQTDLKKKLDWIEQGSNYLRISEYDLDWIQYNLWFNILST